MLTISDFKFFIVFVHEHCSCVRCCVTFDRKFFVFDIDTKNYVILCFDLNLNISFEIFCFNLRNDRFFLLCVLCICFVWHVRQDVRCFWLKFFVNEKYSHMSKSMLSIVSNENRHRFTFCEFIVDHDEWVLKRIWKKKQKKKKSLFL